MNNTAQGGQQCPTAKTGNELAEQAVYCPKCGEPPEVVAGPKLAYWGERFVAWLIDIVILGVIVTLLRFFMGVT